MITKNNYIITRETSALFSEYDESGCENSVVIEKDDVVYVTKQPMKIVQESYEFRGYSYLGALDGARYLLKRRNKVPIAYSAQSGIILIPCNTEDYRGTVWIVSSHIIEIRPHQKNKSRVYFKNGKTLLVGMKFKILHDKYIQASHLQMTMIEREI